VSYASAATTWRARADRRAHARDDLDRGYLYVRIYESMLYADLLIGRTPDVEPAERAARALLLAG